MKEVYKTLAVLVCWSIAAVAYANGECTHGGIRLSNQQATATNVTGGLEVCVNSSWATVCSTGGWHSTQGSSIVNTRVACRQLGYRAEGGEYNATICGQDGPPSPTTVTGLRQGNCSGSELQLIDCPDLRVYRKCAVGTTLTCQLGQCMNRDIRLMNVRSAVGNTDRAGELEVCVNSSWATVCATGGWHNTQPGIENSRVACRQLGYREEGGAHSATRNGFPTTVTGLRQGNCNGNELQLIDCPDLMSYSKCAVGTTLTCQLATCDTTIRLRGGRTATEGRVEVCRDGQWGTVCDDSWDRNDASVACRQLGLSNLNPVAVPSAFFGPGCERIHLSNLQCTGSEVALTDCTFDTEHQCSHNQDASVMCGECTNEDIRIAYDSEIQTVEFCDNRFWNMCDNACQDMNGVRQLGAYFCGSGEITHFLLNGSQLYECPISGAGELLICRPTIQNLSPNCQQVLEAIELRANTDSITILWINDDYAETINNNSTFEITCSPEGSDLRNSIVVEPTNSEVTMENLPHSITYECCVTLHIGRYSTRACSNTATTELPSVSVTPQDQTTAPDGASIALGVLVAVLVLLLVLATGAWLYSIHKIAAMKSTLSDGTTQLNQNPSYALPPTSGSKPAKSGTEAEYEVVDREQPDGAELKQNPAYSVHKTDPQQTNTDTTVYETVDL